jgi:chromate transporter
MVGAGGEPAALDLPEWTRPSWARFLSTLSAWLAIWLLPLAGLHWVLGGGNVFAVEAGFFSKMAVVTFGGAYAVLAYVAQQAVEIHGWLKPDEMLTGLGLAETTPGPLIMVLQFMGFMAAWRNPEQLPPLVAGTLGGALAAYVTFAPCFLWIFAGAPFVEQLRANRALAGAMAAVAAAVVGVIANLALWFATHFLFTAQSAPFAPLPLVLPDVATLHLTALALSLLAGAFLRFGLAAALAVSVAGGVLLGAQ